MDSQNTCDENILLMQILNEYGSGTTININNVSQQYKVDKDLIARTLYHGKNLQLLTINYLRNEITILNALYKTRRCRLLNDNKKCLYGLDCSFIHPGREEQICQQLCGTVIGDFLIIYKKTQLQEAVSSDRYQPNVNFKNQIDELREENTNLHNDLSNLQRKFNDSLYDITDLEDRNDELQQLNDFLEDKLYRSKKDVKKYKKRADKKQSQSRHRSSRKRSRSHITVDDSPSIAQIDELFKN